MRRGTVALVRGLGFLLSLGLVAALPGSALAAGGTIAGTVAGVGKGHQAGASVRVLDGDTGRLAAAATPSGSGAFSITVPEDGAYVLVTSVVAPGKALSTAAVPVSVRKGQRRKGLRITPKRTKRAKRAFVQENGAVTAGVPAFSVENFTGGTGDWQQMNRGLPAMLTTDLVGGTSCETAVTANESDRALILQELRLQKSRFFDPKTRVKRNFVINDYTVRGTISVNPGSGGQSATVAVRIENARTGATVDSFSTTLTTEQFFEGAERLAKVVGERICRRPSAYELTLRAPGDGNFATHRSTATANGTLTALRSGGEPGKQATAWSGVSTYSWSELTVASKTDCSYTNGASPVAPWQASIAVQGEETIQVTWEVLGNDFPTFTVNCPQQNGSVVSVGGQPGPSLLGVTPLTFTLPLLGGTVQLGGGITTGDGGWTVSGTLVVKPIWANDLPQ